MRKMYTFLVLCVTAVTLNAQVFTEYFEGATPGSNLEDWNNWYVTFKSSEAGGVSPVIVDETLFYDGYVGSEKGLSVKLDSLLGMDNDDGTKRISTRVVEFGGGDTLRAVPGKKFYAAFMVSIGEFSKDSWRDFVTWEGSTGSSWQRGRVFVKVQNSGQDLQFAVTCNSSSSGDMVATEVMEGGVGLYHLLVLTYESIDGPANDQMSLYVNPDPTKSEAEQISPLTNVDPPSNEYSDGTEIKFNVRQRGIGALIGGIRIGRTWEEVVMGQTAGDVSVTGVTLDQETLTLDAGTTGTLVATVAPEDATNKTVTWSSNNEAAATVADGVVTAVAAGEATITVTTEDGDFTASCVVTVNAASGVRDAAARGFSMYPNPVSDGILNIDLGNALKAKQIEIYDVLGVLVHAEHIENRSSLLLNTSGLLSSGVYFVKIDSHIEQLIIK